MRPRAFVCILLLSTAISVFLWHVNRHTVLIGGRKIIPQINVNEQYSLSRNRSHQHLLSNFTEMSKLIGAYRLPFTLYRRYILENPRLCSSESSLIMLIVVKSSPTHFENRKILRETWMDQIEKLTSGRTKFLFVMGKTNFSTQIGIEDEFRKYRDILQGDFMDSYRNLTEKGVTFLKWINERCRNAKIILQTDDDVVVNVSNLFKYMLPVIINRSKTIICNLRWAAPIKRNMMNKWSVEEHLFPSTTVFQTYCTGFFVLYTNDLTPLFYEAAKSTPFFWVDDVYLYGLLLNRIPGVNAVKMRKSAFLIGDKNHKSCFYGWQSEACKLITVAGNVKVVELRNFWNEIVRGNFLERNNFISLKESNRSSLQETNIRAIY